VDLKEMGVGIWKETIGGSVSLKNRSNFVAQREGNTNDALSLKTILSGISSPIKESMGQCTSILKTIQMKARNNVMMLAKRKILKTFQIKVNNIHKLLIAIIQNVMILNISLQVKKKI
jgi:uncharacterized membrane protein YjfL (UPF0719 family)